MAKKSIHKYSCVRFGKHAGHVISARGKHYKLTFPMQGYSKKVLKTSKKIKQKKCSMALKRAIKRSKR